MAKRPPKEFMDAAITGIRASGSAGDPGAVAASTWRKMSPAARKPWEALRTLRESNPGIKGRASSAASTAALAAIPGAAPAMLAGQAAQTAVSVLTGDLVVIRSTIPRGTKRKPLPPLEIEYHVNPVGLGLGALVLAVAGGVGWLAWNGISWSTPLGNFQIVEGLKSGAFWQSVVGKITRGKAGGPPDMSGFDCAKLKVYYDGYLAIWNNPWIPSATRERFRQAADQTATLARSKGCAWAL